MKEQNMSNIYWGDSHCNIIGYHYPEKRQEHVDDLDEAFQTASGHLDFFPVAYYPFFRYRKNGMELESVGHHAQFDQEWEKIRRCVKSWNSPGSFITFLGYEWHGNREKYGDHNVFYYDDGPLLAPEGITELYEQLKTHRGIAIPHHTAYQVGMRGKDWDYLDEDLSPFAEIYSNHGSSEGCGSPVKMERNTMMGPRTSGGSIQDGLARGHHIGIIGSSDNHTNFAGAWNSGLMGVVANELTREDLWDAFHRRSVYAVTGDRIQLDFGLNGAPMGSIVDSAGSQASSPRVVQARLKGCDEIDRVEIVKNNRVVQTICLRDTWSIGTRNDVVRFKQRVSMGWGPRTFGPPEKLWHGQLSVRGGKILSVEPCYTCKGQSYELESDKRCSWDLVTKRTDTNSPFKQTPFHNQALIFEIEAKHSSELSFEINGLSRKFTVDQLLAGSSIMTLREETERLVRSEFGLGADDIENDGQFWLDSHKVKFHTAVPSQAYETSIEWTDGAPDAATPEDFYYLRVTQSNGQVAWTSPVWVTK